MEWWINSYSTQHSSPLKLIFHGIVWVWIESNLFSIVFLSSWFYNAVLSLSCSSLCLAEIKLNLIRVQYPFNISPSRAFTAICLFVYVKYAWFTSLLIILSNNIVIYKRIKRNVLSPNGVTDLFQQVWVYILLSLIPEDFPHISFRLLLPS